MASMLHAFEVTYEGVGFNGSAGVVANTAEEAIELVRQDERTAGFRHAKAEDLGPLVGPRVLSNWNGDA